MSLRTRKSINQRHIVNVERTEKRKFFILAEGEKTEVKYFEGIKTHSRDLGISDLLEIVPLYKDGRAKGITNPKGLADLANEFIENSKKNEQDYYEDIDKFLLVFDRDKDDFKNYFEFIDENKDKFILGITNPCFELWLLLHHANSVEEIIKKDENNILENRKVSNSHTYLSKKISELYKMNPKKKFNFLYFKNDLSNAIEQERKLVQDIYGLEGKIGSNIGKIIQDELINVDKI